MSKIDTQKVVKALGGNQFNFDAWYAEAWSKKQGYFSERLANKLIKYLKEKNIMIQSVLDVCSGSGEFISSMRNICTRCVGIDEADAYLEFTRSRYHDVEFQKVEKLYDFKLKEKFDLISCNRDVVNMFTQFKDWQTFFKTVYAHLNNRGLFMFDFYTEKKLNGWNEVIYEEGTELDYVSKVTQNNGLCVISEIYYLKESSLYYRKTNDVNVEAWFKNADILKALSDAGFKKITLMNSNFEPLDGVALSDANRIHVLAEK